MFSTVDRTRKGDTRTDKILDRILYLTPNCTLAASSPIADVKDFPAVETHKDIKCWKVSSEETTSLRSLSCQRTVTAFMKLLCISTDAASALGEERLMLQRDETRGDKCGGACGSVKFDPGQQRVKPAS